MHEEPFASRGSAPTETPGRICAACLPRRSPTGPAAAAALRWKVLARLCGPYCLHDAGDLPDVQACLQLLDGLMRGSLRSGAARTTN